MDITPIAMRLRIIANCVKNLTQYREFKRGEFLQSSIVTAATERYFQIAIQAALDISNIILSEAGTDFPKEYRDIFPKLAEIGVLPGKLAQKMVGMAKFRNVLVHLYMEVDHNRLYDYLQNDLDDFVQFAQYVSEHLAQQAKSQIDS